MHAYQSCIQAKLCRSPAAGATPSCVAELAAMPLWLACANACPSSKFIVPMTASTRRRAHAAHQAAGPPAAERRLPIPIPFAGGPCILLPALLYWF